ncbi:hypothetical protein GGR54DRAFT_388364 [Hypoxylon sp. NC1633]|nr:hypothetical protein GGR54DRAFT_388364 [Hypoxylon sp. NC1633]
MSGNDTDPVKHLGLSCPEGGNFHICQNSRTRFIGCCDEDPCADGSGLCRSTDLHRATFNPSMYNEIPTQGCTSTSGGLIAQWYTCVAGPFMGCCLSNPCAHGGDCPATDLVAARLSDDDHDAAVFVTSAATSSAAPTSSADLATATVVTTLSTSSPGAVATSAPVEAPPADVPPTAKIVGGTVGGVVGLVLIVCFIFLYIRRRKAAARQAETAVSAGSYQGETTRPPWSPYKDSFTASPSTAHGMPSPGFPSPTMTNNGRTSDMSQFSGQGTTWDSRHGSYSKYGATASNDNWADSQHPLHRPYALNPVSELEGTSSYHELDSGTPPQSPPPVLR